METRSEISANSFRSTSQKALTATLVGAYDAYPMKGTLAATLDTAMKRRFALVWVIG